ncbi:hypothetical protein [Nocardia fluminea]|uniref:hypothetical protein n=1 Tax=Nocardia fluminea TaxID=134984 RepID=UPI00365ABACD
MLIELHNGRFSGDAFDDLTAMLTPVDVLQYLATHNWVLDARHPGVSEVWSLPGGTSGQEVESWCRCQPTTSIFRHFRDSIRTLSTVYGLRPSLLAGRFAALRSNVLFVRLDQETTHGEIPLGQTELTLRALVKMI